MFLQFRSSQRTKVSVKYITFRTPQTDDMSKRQKLQPIIGMNYSMQPKNVFVFMALMSLYKL
ncbi:hypothetical protein DKP84_16170 [Acinetobacter pittii]|nr:hypothetical protein DKP84_16170 [Acinetobacter pittii]